MKTLLVLRHAKSSHDDPSLPDHDRPLKGRGKRAARKIGHLLDRESLWPERVFSSTATRAAATIRRVLEASGQPEDYAASVDFHRDLYTFDVGSLVDVVRRLGGPEQSLMIVGHNPAFENLDGDSVAAADATFRGARRLDIGELEEARDLARVALRSFQGLGDSSAEADVLTLLGRVAHLWGSYEEALECYGAALPLERGAGDRQGEADILCRLGMAEVDFGHFTQALAYFDQALEIYGGINHRAGCALALAHPGTAFRWLGRYDEAAAAARQAEDVARACGSRSALATAQLVRAIAGGAAGRIDEAKQQLRDLLCVIPKLRKPALEAHAWLALGELESGFEAREAVKRARWIAASSGFVHIEVLGLTRLAELALEADEPAAAETYSRNAIEILERHGDIQGPDEVVYFTHSGCWQPSAGRTKPAKRANGRARSSAKRRVPSKTTSFAVPSSRTLRRIRRSWRPRERNEPGGRVAPRGVPACP